MPFEKIDSKNSEYVHTYEEFKIIYEHFKQFADDLTIKAGRAKKPSGKASSYARYLMRLVIFVRREFDPHFQLKVTFAALKQIERLEKLEGFIQYNKTENHFPSATINCFRSFVAERAMAVEDMIDTEENVEYLTSKELPVVKEEALIYAPTKRTEKKPSKFGTTYTRSVVESLAAKQRSNYRCEMSDTHFTFLTEHHKKPYVESHHLIPMAAQDYFEHTIDFAHNIATLCPTCHRKIHYAEPHEKEEMLQYLFNKRQHDYIKYGIEIDFKTLCSFYKIL